MNTLTWAGCAIAFSLLIAGCSTSGQDPVAGGNEPEPIERELTVETGEGEVEGVEQDGVFIYRGIPYAAAPVGDLRWQPPQPALARNESLLADKPGNACVQDLPIVGKLGDEDCLVLNITTPAEGNGLPVMVWIHGGGFILGEGTQSDGGTLGDKITRETGTVVVTINYRLGPFGFLAHPGLTAESPYGASGNYGLMDQTAALQWVRDNIAGFGGDPANVTIFGESAGAFSICSHLSSPLSTGLFHKAIVQSGSCLRPWPTLANAEGQGDTFAQKIGCNTGSDTLSCMRNKSAEEVLNAFPPGANYGFADIDRTGASWWPILDGHFFSRQSADSIASGDFNQVPILYGFTRDEAQLFTWLTENDFENPLPITEDNYDAFLAHLLGGNTALVAQVRVQYPPASYAAPAQALGAMSTDATFRCPGRDELALLAQHTPSWLYQFEYEDAAFQLDDWVPRPDYGLGAFHSAEIQYVFGVPAAISKTEFDAGIDQDLWHTMMGYWTRFAATGNPNGDGAANWPQWSAGGDEYLAFDAMTKPATGAAAAECEFWEDKDYLIPQLSQ